MPEAALTAGMSLCILSAARPLLFQECLQVLEIKRCPDKKDLSLPLRYGFVSNAKQFCQLKLGQIVLHPQGADTGAKCRLLHCIHLLRHKISCGREADNRLLV